MLIETRGRVWTAERERERSQVFDVFLLEARSIVFFGGEEWCIFHVDGAGDRCETRVRLVRVHKTWLTCSFQVLQ